MRTDQQILVFGGTGLRGSIHELRASEWQEETRLVPVVSFLPPFCILCNYSNYQLGTFYSRETSYFLV